MKSEELTHVVPGAAFFMKVDWVLFTMWLKPNLRINLTKEKA